MAVCAILDTDVRLGSTVALIGADKGRYPYGNSLLVVGSEGTVLIDPSVSVSERGGAPGVVDKVLLSHAHEDHMAGLHLYPDTAVYAHHDDLLGVQSIEGLLTMYGMSPDNEAAWKPTLLKDFNFVARPDAAGFAGGDCFELGRGLRVEVIHLPGHTRGHCGFLIEPDGVFFVADVDLSAFGPYYGDHWSNLEDFEAAIARCREVDARWYATFHHKGIIEGRAAFLATLEDFHGVIERRDRRLVDFLAEPRSLQQIVAHRLVYRQGDKVIWIDDTERRTALAHLERLMQRGQVRYSEDGLYRVA